MRIFFLVLIFLDTILIFYFLFTKNYLYLLNSQIAMIASLFVTYASFLGYKKVVIKKSKEYINIDDRDVIDKIEDRFDLYSEEKKENEIDAKKVFEEEKQKLKNSKENLKNFFMTSGGFLSIYRIISYLFLIFSILFLINNKEFNAIAYFIGLSIVPISALITSLVGFKR
ncbi:hypothetical protein [Nitrosophilus kaiyonis]|uniref:hypothetical protein n=1 Tax=Nitrosophilus kaiyonis TaxID=2930200 RepID=UPI0024929A49|nr:hypothetical protein [Nitrosophilus kaiyonis]